MLRTLTQLRAESRTLSEIRDVTGMSRSRISNLLRVARKARPLWLEWAGEGGNPPHTARRPPLSLKHLEAVLELEAGIAEQLLRRAMAAKWSAQQLRQEVKHVRYERGDTRWGEPRPHSANADADLAALENALSETLGTVVRVRPRPDGGGDLVLKYTDNDTLEGLLERLGYRTESW